MSDWLKKESDDFQGEHQTAEDKKRLIALSDYWHLIIREIEKDIAFINTESPWTRHLGNNVVQITRKHAGEYLIEKVTLPGVSITLTNSADLVKIKVELFTYGLKVTKDWKEEWKVDTDGERVMLTRDTTALFVPEDVSRHVLLPIVEELRKETGTK
jgi:hypothetical protein